MTPKELLMAHRYAEAVEAHETHMAIHPEDNYYQSLGLSFLCLNRFSEALSSFTKDNEIETKRRNGASASLDRIGATLWLMGKKEEAMREWHRAASGVLDGSIHYGDSAGGAIQGLLLWYGAVTLKHTDRREYALDYLRHIKSKKVYGSAVLWPRPVALMVLGDYSFENVLEISAGSSDLETCLTRARTHLLKRRRLCQTLFYGACQERQMGNETECLKRMRLCSQLENPIVESEWYLARDEK